VPSRLKHCVEMICVHSWLKHNEISLMRHVYSRLKHSLNINATLMVPISINSWYSTPIKKMRRHQEYTIPNRVQFVCCGSFQLTMSCERWFFFKEEHNVLSMTIWFNVCSRSKHSHSEVNFTAQCVFKLKHSAEMLWQCQTLD
jgi:hypothetical protein